ncbi:MAG: HD domain-containing protein [Anaerolineales bacterium]|nr:HD domain-containing protein [Anaerolineales bacterium]
MPTVEEAQEWYDPHDPVHGFDHVLRVLKLAQKIGEELGADLEIIYAAALLHDATDAAPGDEGKRESHEQNSADFARRILLAESWEEDRIEAVQRCIRTHRFRGSESPNSLEAKILFDADKLDVVGAFGVARTLGYAIQAGKPFFAEPSERFLSSGVEEQGESHSAYHEYLFKLKRVPERLFTYPARRMAERRHEVLVQFFEQLAQEARGEE